MFVTTRVCVYVCDWLLGSTGGLIRNSEPVSAFEVCIFESLARLLGNEVLPVSLLSLL